MSCLARAPWVDCDAVFVPSGLVTLLFVCIVERAVLCGTGIY
jgi:hypothetical protein